MRKSRVEHVSIRESLLRFWGNSNPWAVLFVFNDVRILKVAIMNQADGHEMYLFIFLFMFFGGFVRKIRNYNKFGYFFHG